MALSRSPHVCLSAKLSGYTVLLDKSSCSTKTPRIYFQEQHTTWWPLQRLKLCLNHSWLGERPQSNNTGSYRKERNTKCEYTDTHGTVDVSEADFHGTFLISFQAKNIQVNNSRNKHGGLNVRWLNAFQGDLQSHAQNWWTFTNICEYLKANVPPLLFDTLSHSPEHLPFRHIPSAETLKAGTTEAV